MYPRGFPIFEGAIGVKFRLGDSRPGVSAASLASSLVDRAGCPAEDGLYLHRVAPDLCVRRFFRVQIQPSL